MCRFCLASDRYNRSTEQAGLKETASFVYACSLKHAKHLTDTQQALKLENKKNTTTFSMQATSIHDCWTRFTILIHFEAGS